MHPLEGVVWQVEWAGGNFAYNLGFIAEDKINWKPAPSAPSALEVANHTVESLAKMSSVLRGASYDANVDFAPATTREQAQIAIRTQSALFAQTVRGLRAEELDDKVVLPWGEHTKAEAAGMDAIEIVHHHGQIAYIQMLLGDTESHFEMFNT